MIHGSLFSGIGGFDLASDWMGWENAFHCEWNEFGRKVLNYYWPNAKSYEDITKTDFTIWRGKIDILTGGFPCQPYSAAGKRLGKEDDRHLWPEMLRAIREIQPKYIVGENVLGLTNWNGGMVFDEVQTQMEAEGYEVIPVVLPACGVNAPHRRERVWFIAYCGSFGCNNRGYNREKRHIQNNINGNASKDKPERGEWKCRASEIRNVGTATNTKSKQSEWMQSEQREISEQEQIKPRGSDSKNGSDWDATNAPSIRQSKQGESIGSMRSKTDREWKASWSYNDGRWPTQSPICSRDDGFSERLHGITFPKWRQESIKAYGNAIVPQVAYEIFKVIDSL